MAHSKRKKSPRHFPKSITLIVLFLLLVVGVCLGYRYWKLNTWKTYTNDKYGFSIDYPPDTKVITELNQDGGTRNMQKNWHLLLTNQEDYPNIENSLYGKGFYSIQVEISDSASYTFPFKGKIPVTEDNFDSVFGEGFEKGLVNNRPVLKSRVKGYPNKGSIIYIIYDNDRIFEININSDNLDKVPLTILDRIISSLQIYETASDQ